MIMPRNAFPNLPMVGVEDGSFQKGITIKTVLAAVLFRNLHIEDVKVKKITVDGFEATERLKEMLSSWNFEAVLLAGISFAGFNVIDPILIHEEFNKPVIIITRTKPNNKAVKKALEKHFEDWKRRFEVFEKIGLPYERLSFAGKSPVYVKAIWASFNWACTLIHGSSILGVVPEPLRVARLIARGLS